MLKLAYLLSCFTVVNAGSHSLMAFATYIVGQAPFPEFSVVVMLDDMQIGYYDSNTSKFVYRSHSDPKYYNEDQKDAAVIFQDTYDDMKMKGSYAKKNFNLTEGVFVYQRLVGCELLNNGKPGPLYFWGAYDGKYMEKFTYDLNNIHIERPWITSWDQLKRLHLKLLYENVYHPICIKVLLRYLHLEKNHVMRKVKPRVRLMRKKHLDSQGLQISCLATGFYPRHIDLTLFRDDQPVDDDQITGGEILPNGDGTYQMRKNFVISKEELREGHNYNCTMSHLNLDNKLNIIFDTAKYDQGGSFSLSLVSLLLFMLAVLIITLFKWMKRSAAGRGSEKSQNEYSPTSSSTDDEN